MTLLNFRIKGSKHYYVVEIFAVQLQCYSFQQSVNDRDSRRRGSNFFPADFQFLPEIWPGIFD